MPSLPGGCYCAAVRYTITLDDPAAQARTSLCHCGGCKRFTGGNYGITTRVPRAAFAVERGRGRDHVRAHEADNGAGVALRREFCGVCGGGILEFGENAGDNIYVFYGTLDDEARRQVAPKGEFFCKMRDSWMPEVEGLFHKNEIKE
ncbi:Mss4-like protein [Nemania sp. NC0429]|nr:Mss4-like protein [Nemania sp. NC0429]